MIRACLQVAAMIGAALLVCALLIAHDARPCDEYRRAYQGSVTSYLPADPANAERFARCQKGGV